MRSPGSSQRGKYKTWPAAKTAEGARLPYEAPACVALNLATLKAAAANGDIGAQNKIACIVQLEKKRARLKPTG